MNILQIVPALNVGGVETGTVDIAKALKSRGHKCVVVSSGGVLVDELEKQGIAHYELPVHKKSLLSILSLQYKLRDIIVRERIDVVHARSRVPAWIAYLACRKTQAPFITTCHGYYSRHFFSRVMGWGKRVIVASNVMREHMIEGFGVLPDKIRYIPRGVDIDKYKFKIEQGAKKEYIVATIGRLTPLKGQADFIKAVARAVKKNPYIEAWIVGDASADKLDYKNQLITLVNSLGVSRYVSFLGRCDDVPGLLSQIDILVLATATQETFGRVIIEAQAAGVPVIATSVGGIVEIIEDRKTGILVPPASPDAISDAILELLRERTLASSMAVAARKKVEELYTLDTMADATYQIYKEAQEISSIVVLKLGAFGDLILITPSLRALRENFHNAKIRLVTREEFKTVLSGCPYVDEIIPVKGDKKLRELLGVGRILRRIMPDVVIDLQNSKASHILAYLSGSFRRYGYDNGKLSFLLNNRIRGAKLPIPPVAHQFRVLNLVGVRPKDERLELWEDPKDKDYIKRLFLRFGIKEDSSLIGINIGASARWRTKRWQDDKFAKLIERLSDKGKEILLLGSSDDIKTAGDIANSSSCKPHIFAGTTTLNQLSSLIKRLSLLITPDSAPMHVAAAWGVPFVALFGPTDPKRHVPPATDYMIIRKDIRCSPCYKSNCSNVRCMKEMEVEDVRVACEEMLRLK